MAITVLLVKALNPEGTAGTTTVAIATLAYQEQDTDSAGQKLGGALLNAIIFMAVIAGMTFVLFLLFKWGCYKLIYGYMGFAMLNIFFAFTGALVLQLLRLMGLHMDLFSLTFLLFNFSVLGILSLFVMPVPLFLKQCYTVWVGICVAYIFTHIPEWTSWVLLVIMALYDLAAVLLPGGPLKILVELAIEREQELPALIYESRPTNRPYQRGMWRRQPGQDGTSAAHRGDGVGPAPVVVLAEAGGLGVLAGDASGSPSVAARVALLGEQRRSWDEASQVSQELALAGSSSSVGGSGGARRRGSGTGVRAGNGAVPLAEAKEEREECCTAQQEQQMLLLQQGGIVKQLDSFARQQQQPQQPQAEAVLEPWEMGRRQQQAGGSSAAAGAISIPGPAAAAGEPIGGSTGAADAGGGDAVPAQHGRAGSSDGDEGSEVELPDGIKLGLGDFIFYSMLVGRAAMYDMTTVFASYIAVISGLGITLMLLALYRKALPALPVSIALGVLFYFITRLVELQTGRFFYTDGAIYEGQYKVVGLPPPTPPEPAKKGTFKTGDYSYTGEWLDDEMHGQGKFSFASGACYEGCWEHNRYQGQGSYTFPDGTVYKGDWVFNVMHGQGSFADTEGHCWAGQFYNGAGPGLTCQL
ncbi:Presenilin-domain-containing protein [Scenedesmus sp. NREL 46B-D3]|nr:Presenilin-domain-containing protein [Scenedesmus sp. NREL 46B-D3]